MAIITATIEDDTFDFSQFAVDYTDGCRYSFEVIDVTNDEYESLWTRPPIEAVTTLTSRITKQDGDDGEPVEVEHGELPVGLVTSYLRLHVAFLRELANELAT